MTCNGKTYPLLTKANFDMVIFGNQQKGKIKVVADFKKEKNQWMINSMDLVTNEGRKVIYKSEG